MSWHFSQALVEEYWPEKCLGGDASAQSSGSPTPQAYLCSDRMTAFSRLSRFGMTFAPLTGDLGEGVLMSFLEAFPARTSAQPEKAQESKASDLECGWRWHESSVKYDPATSSWRTRQCSLLGGLVEFSETWPRWGSMRNGECWEQPMLVRRISGTESGLWPTPRSCTAMAATITPESVWNEKRFPNLETVVGQRNWPKPTSRDHKGCEQNGRIRDGKLQTDTLYRAVHQQNGSGSLNPTWIEWLMGWPIEWTALKPLETAKYPNAQPKHGESCTGD